MRYVKTLRNSLLVCLGLALLAGAVGCNSTFTPAITRPQAPSWDGTNQNSGVVAVAKSPTGEVTGAVLTGHGRDRYNALMNRYGADWGVRGQDQGLTACQDGTWAIDAQHLSYFIRANLRDKNTSLPVP